MTDIRTIRLAGGAQGFNWLPVFVAEELGIFAEHGLRIEYQRLGSVDKATRAVSDGAADVAITPPEGAIADAVAGGDLRIIGANAQRLPMALVAAPGITSLADLRGRRIGTSSLTEGTAIYVRRVLSTVGLEYPADYDFVLAGVHTTRWAALEAGEIDAAPQPTPWSLLAEREGFELVAEIPEFIPEIIFAAVIGRAQWLDANPDTAQRLVHALSEAHAYVNDPAGDDVTGPIYQRLTINEAPELAAAGLAETRALSMWPEGLRVADAAFATTVDCMVETELLSEDQRVAASLALDPRFTQS